MTLVLEYCGRCGARVSFILTEIGWEDDPETVLECPNCGDIKDVRDE